MRYAEKLAAMVRFGNDLGRLSTDPRLKVGCVVFPVDCSAVHGIGYNGAAAGLPHDRIDPGAAHAEANALAKCGSPPWPTLLYVSHAPCANCAALIVNCGHVVGVIWDGPGVGCRGLDILAEAGIPAVPAETVLDGALGAWDPTARGAAAVAAWAREAKRIGHRNRTLGARI